MGPWPGDHGNRLSSLAQLGHYPASMGPWPGDHGNLHLNSRFLMRGRASMGPWPGDHGNICAPEAGLITEGLQWGRGLVTTEIQVVQ